MHSCGAQATLRKRRGHLEFCQSCPRNCRENCVCVCRAGGRDASQSVRDTLARLLYSQESSLGGPKSNNGVPTFFHAEFLHSRPFPIGPWRGLPLLRWRRLLARPRDWLCERAAATDVEVLVTAGACEAGSTLGVDFNECKDQLAARAARSACTTSQRR